MEDGALVGFQRIQPVLDVCGVVLSVFGLSSVNRPFFISSFSFCGRTSNPTWSGFAGAYMDPGPAARDFGVYTFEGAGRELAGGAQPMG